MTFFCDSRLLIEASTRVLEYRHDLGCSVRHSELLANGLYATLELTCLIRHSSAKVDEKKKRREGSGSGISVNERNLDL
jgi:hypothetical protein